MDSIGESAIGQNADHVFGKILGCRQHHGSRAHGNARQNDARILVNAMDHEIDPCEAIAALSCAKRDHVALALACASLINDQCVMPDLEAAVNAAAKIALGRAAVAVK